MNSTFKSTKQKVGLLKRVSFQKKKKSTNFYPIALKGCQDIVFTYGVWMGGRREKGPVSQIVRCRKLTLGREIG